MYDFILEDSEDDGDNEEPVYQDTGPFISEEDEDDVPGDENRITGEIPEVIEDGMKQYWEARFYNSVNLEGNPAAHLTYSTDFLDFSWPGNPDKKVNKDNFSIRFDRDIYAKSPGIYHFFLTGDDGIRLYIDDALLIDEWKDQAAATYNTSCYFSGGEHHVRVEYYERSGYAVIKFEWRKNSTGRAEGSISGKVYLREKTGENVPVIVLAESGPDFVWADYVEIPAGSDRVPYSIEIPEVAKGKPYTVSYITESSAFVHRGFYQSHDTTHNSALSQPITFSGRNIKNVDLTLMNGITIRGTISKPSGIREDTTVIIEVSNGSRKFGTSVFLPAKTYKKIYDLTVPTTEDFKKYYVTYIIPGSDNLFSSGYYSEWKGK